ncbi:MarC family protein [Candidatus Nitronereus thalassa]|uniref:UPF0056 membrane protein n=1 Tax=Candidatus Nitronereus thalassa TaxID=3020898 RepID=A0ABU3K5N0_9BACT|nr:MarC family protein [Candidatus Nitronereus thalassa]MDT7041719.1 MarC family protein [Candidatus Nitronereus thalassa]
MDLLNFSLLALGSLFVVVNPISGVSAFLAMTGRDIPEDKLRMAKVACMVAVGVLLGFALLGSTLFTLLGIMLPAFQLAGGLVLLLIALDMLRGQRSSVQESPEEAKEAIEKLDIAVTPLGIPLLAGPGAITTVMLLETQAQHWGARAVLCACIALVGLASYVIFSVAIKRASWFGPIAMKITIRLMGLVVAAIAVQFMFNAIQEAFGLHP